MESLYKIANRKAVIYYLICIILTIGGYLAELLKGQKSILGLFILMAVTVVPLVISILMYKKAPDNRKVKTFIGIAFTIGYSYILLTFSRFTVYSLILVMLPILTLNTSKKNIYMFALMVLLANIARIILQFKGVYGDRLNLMEHFIQLATIALVFMCTIGTHAITFMHNKQQIDELNSEKENQQKAINTTNSIMNSVRDYSAKLSQNVDNLNTYSKDVSQITNDTNDSAVYGSKVVSKISENSESVSNSSEQVGESIEELKIRVERINESISDIYKISRQINLLSLNAAVESARSGEAGQGFAVVADEIKSLANRTAESSRGIEEIIKELNDDVNNSVCAKEALDEANKEQNQLIKDVADTYFKIRNSMGDVANRVGTMNEMITSVSDSNRTMIESMEK